MIRYLQKGDQCISSRNKVRVISDAMFVRRSLLALFCRHNKFNDRLNQVSIQNTKTETTTTRKTQQEPNKWVEISWGGRLGWIQGGSDNSSNST